MVSLETDTLVPRDDDLHLEGASQAGETVAEDVPEKVAIMFKEFDNTQIYMKLQIEGKLEDLKTKQNHWGLLRLSYNIKATTSQTKSKTQLNT